MNRVLDQQTDVKNYMKVLNIRIYLGWVDSDAREIWLNRFEIAGRSYAFLRHTVRRILSIDEKTRSCLFRHPLDDKGNTKRKHKCKNI